MTLYAYLAGQWLASDRLGLTKMAAIPKAVLEAAEATGSFLGRGGGGKSWSLMGGEGGALSKDLMARMSGKQVPGYGERAAVEAEKLLSAQHRGAEAIYGPGQNPMTMHPVVRGTPKPMAEGPVPMGTVAARPSAKAALPGAQYSPPGRPLSQLG